MSKLQKEELKLSQLSRQLQLTVAETSRHLQRLNEAKLIQKNTYGKYGLTQFGRLAMVLLLSMLCSGTALVSVTLMGITIVLAVVVLFGLVAVLFVISRFKR